MSGWSGADVRRERARWAPRLPVPCCRCHRPVIPNPALPHNGWQVDHWPVPRELGGTDTWPAHSTCNLSAGGRRGAEITNARRAQATTPETRMTPETERRIRPRW